MEPAGIVALLILLVVVFRLIAGGLDHGRVEEYVRRHGGELLSQRWSPFGRGWFGSQNERLYEIRYLDRDRVLHEATAKTSMFAGVYLTEDRVVRTPEGAEPERSDLERENERLRRRLAELERRSEEPEHRGGPRP